MEIKKLRYFLAVAEAGSFAKASQLTYVAQPALSQQITNLEAELGAKVFDRSHRGIELTPAGLLLREHALKILAQVKLAKEDIARHCADTEARVLVTMPPSLSQMLSLALIHELKQRSPDAQLSILDSTASLERDLFVNGHLVVGLLYRPFPHESVQSVPLIEESLCLVVRADHPLAAAEVPIEALHGLALVLPAAPNAMRDRIDHVLQVRGVSPRLGGEFNSLATLCNAVQASGMATVLPKSLVANAARFDKLVCQSIVMPEIRHTIYLGLSRLIPWRALDRTLLRALLKVVYAFVDSGAWPGATLRSEDQMQADVAAYL